MPRKQGRSDFPILHKIHSDLAHLMRLQGRTWADIAERLGYSGPGAVHNLVHGHPSAPHSYASARDFQTTPDKQQGGRQ